MSLTFEKLRRRQQIAHRYELVLDTDWATELVAAHAELDKNPTAKRERELRAKVEELEARREESVVAFEIRRLGSSEYEALVTANPPTAEQRRKEDDEGVPLFQRSSWNPDTFAPALVQAAVVSPELDDAGIKELRELLSHAEWMQLYTTCLRTTTQAANAPAAR